MRPTAHILTVGNEVLKGSVLNTNARFLGRELTGLGFEVHSQSSCRDVIAEIKSALARALQTADLVIMSGGLGPTPDDLTREAVAAYFDVPLHFSKRQFDFIRYYYRKRRRPIPEIVRKEALFPKNAKPLFNRYGIALGFHIRQAEKTIVVLPGVPYELEKMFHHQVLPVLARYFSSISKRYNLVVKTVGLSEPAVMEALGKDFFNDSFDFGIYPHPGEATLRIYAESKHIISLLESKIRKRLAKSIYAWGEKSLSETIGDVLRKKKKTLAVAESCSGGLLSWMMTQVPGSSDYFRGSVIVYQSDIKAWIGVPKLALRRGAVSAIVAKELAENVRRVLKSDYGVALTGVAGPKKDGKKPVGKVYIALASALETTVSEQDFIGERVPIQTKASVRALEILWKKLCGN